jgi:hypothetical protein
LLLDYVDLGPAEVAGATLMKVEALMAKSAINESKGHEQLDKFLAQLEVAGISEDQLRDEWEVLQQALFVVANGQKEPFETRSANLWKIVQKAMQSCCSQLGERETLTPSMLVSFVEAGRNLARLGISSDIAARTGPEEMKLEENRLCLFEPAIALVGSAYVKALKLKGSEGLEEAEKWLVFGLSFMLLIRRPSRILEENFLSKDAECQLSKLRNHVFALWYVVDFLEREEGEQKNKQAKVSRVTVDTFKTKIRKLIKKEPTSQVKLETKHKQRVITMTDIFNLSPVDPEAAKDRSWFDKELKRTVTKSLQIPEELFPLLHNRSKTTFYAMIAKTPKLLENPAKFEALLEVFKRNPDEIAVFTDKLPDDAKEHFQLQMNGLERKRELVILQQRINGLQKEMPNSEDLHKVVAILRSEVEATGDLALGNSLTAVLKGLYTSGVYTDTATEDDLINVALQKVDEASKRLRASLRKKEVCDVPHALGQGEVVCGDVEAYLAVMETHLQEARIKDSFNDATRNGGKWVNALHKKKGRAFSVVKGIDGVIEGMEMNRVHGDHDSTKRILHLLGSNAELLSTCHWDDRIGKLREKSEDLVDQYFWPILSMCILVSLVAAYLSLRNCSSDPGDAEDDEDTESGNADV